MNERIQRLVHQVLTSDINPPTHEIECDPFDEKLSEPMFVAKRFYEFYNAQPIVIGDDSFSSNGSHSISCVGGLMSLVRT